KLQPVAGSQLPTVQGSPSVQVRRRPGRQPAKGTQRSSPLHMSSSAQAASFGSKVQVRPSSSHTSAVHSTPSSQGGSPATQTPSMHSSMPLQKQPSLHWLVVVQASPR